MARTTRTSAPATPDIAAIIAAAVAEAVAAAMGTPASAPAEDTPAPAKRDRKPSGKPNAAKESARTESGKTDEVFTVRKSWKGQESRQRMIAAAIWHGVPAAKLAKRGGGYVDKFTCASLIGEARVAKSGDPIKRVEIVA